MHDLVSKLALDFKDIHFNPGDQFCWSPENNEVTYKENTNSQESIWSLLHEASHGVVEAWSKAKSLAKKYTIEIGEEHIEDCLDTYRDWLYKRSICPTCNTKCLQQENYTLYRCFNCHTTWKVSPSRFCRAYRSTKKVPQTATLI
jgi:hypothetical protein